MAITSAQLSSDDVVVANTDTLIQTTFPSPIDPNTFGHEDFSGDFIFNPRSRTSVSGLGPANTVFTFIMKSDIITDEAYIILDFSGIAEDTIDEELGVGVLERTIKVISKPDFEMFAHTEKSFALGQYFCNPLQGISDGEWIIAAPDDWVAPQGSNITFENNSVKVSNPTEDGFLIQPIGTNNFRDVVIPVIAMNDAGGISYDFVLRVISAKPTLVGRQG